MRFSTVGGEKGSADTARDPRGYAIKFYTEEGNWDMVGNNTPVFFIRDAIKFPDFIHTQKRDPRTNLPYGVAAWDFWSLSPESTHQVTILMSDRGTPDGYRHMNGYSSHTFRWTNKNGESYWVKLHFKTKSGIKNFTWDEATQRFSDPDYATRDLVEHIDQGKTAEWDLYIQAIPEMDGFKYRWNIFDVTKVVPHGDYPLIPVGTLVLNKNVTNYFQETEQSAFSPSNLVPGMAPSFDKMLQGRLFSYPDTHRHRLGGNYEQIPINCPYRAKIHNGHRDGFMRVDGNGGSEPNYEPNSIKGGVNTYSVDKDARFEPYRVTGLVARHRPNHPNCDFSQPGTLFRKVMTDRDREHTISNIFKHISGVPRDIQERAVKNFFKADPEYGNGLGRLLGFSAIKPRI